MITGELRNQVDKLCTEFWTGDIANPLMVIEQISSLMFARLLDIRETRDEKKARRTKKSFKRIFQENKQDLRWSHFNKMTPADRMLEHVRDKAKKTICLQNWVYDMEAFLRWGRLVKNVCYPYR